MHATSQYLRDLIVRMRFYEQHGNQHFDGYEITLAEFREARDQYPVEMAMRILTLPAQDATQ